MWSTLNDEIPVGFGWICAHDCGDVVFGLSEPRWSGWGWVYFCYKGREYWRGCDVSHCHRVDHHSLLSLVPMKYSHWKAAVIAY